MIGAIIFGVLLLMAAYAVLGGADKVLGQPRRSNGNYGRSRTTLFEDVLKAIGAIIVILMIAMVV
ncbi:hypothetical protein [Natrinema sp. DC36]|uniref:hypothetical protein n=1 Tax=Natrinema sp. DC36 TaxID=2878680 RepID=UPI001CF03944|nr:hypothetical protein [Natrinema sp. DC36]